MARAVHGFAFASGRSRLQSAARLPLRAALLCRTVTRTASGGRLRALGRFWRWQIARRTGSTSVVVDLGRGASFSVPGWSQIGGMILATGSHEPAETLVLDRLVGTDDVLVDVGSNIGFYAVRAAVAGARVLAFEPTERAADASLTSAALAGVGDRMRVERCALADQDGEEWFNDADDVGNALSSPGEGRKLAVRRLDTLADTVPRPGPGGITVLKIDAEGADLRVLRGARSFIEARRPVIMVEAWDGGRPLLELLEGCRYQAFRAGPTGLEALPDHFWQANIFAVSIDCLPAVRNRLARFHPATLSPPRVVSWRGR